jgi:hypothetical protein
MEHVRGRRPGRRGRRERVRGEKAPSFQWRWDVRVRSLKGEGKKREGSLNSAMALDYQREVCLLFGTSQWRPGTCTVLQCTLVGSRTNTSSALTGLNCVFCSCHSQTPLINVCDLLGWISYRRILLSSFLSLSFLLQVSISSVLVGAGFNCVLVR